MIRLLSRILPIDPRTPPAVGVIVFRRPTGGFWQSCQCPGSG